MKPNFHRLYNPFLRKMSQQAPSNNSPTKLVFNRILPTKADNNYTGSWLASVVFLLLAIVGIIRSCIHLFAPDGGAGSIAGLDLSVAGAEGIIFAFSLWGSAQLLNALIQIIVYWRYKTLIPLMYLIMAVESLLRILVGQLKPVTFAHTPPGAISNYILLPLALVMCYLSLRNGQTPAEPVKPKK